MPVRSAFCIYSGRGSEHRRMLPSQIVRLTPVIQLITSCRVTPLCYLHSLDQTRYFRRLQDPSSLLHGLLEPRWWNFLRRHCYLAASLTHSPKDPRRRVRIRGSLMFPPSMLLVGRGNAPRKPPVFSSCLSVVGGCHLANGTDILCIPSSHSHGLAA
jgi:hypothetical protein